MQWNHAAVAPLPARSAAALVRWATRAAERGGLDWTAWSAEADALRGLAARLLNVGPSLGGADSISIVPNTTSGLNLVAQGFPFAAGDSVVTTASEFPANLTPWIALESRGVAVRRVPTRDGAFAVEDIASACDGTTRLVSVSAVAFHTGFRAPWEALGALCDSRGIVFGLDGIQALGVVPIDAGAPGLDFVASCGHKWLLGPEGCGILYTSPRLRERLAAPAGWTNLAKDRGDDYHVPERPAYRSDGRRFEPGTLATPGVFALAESLRLLLEIGVETVAHRVARTHEALLEGLPRLGFTPVLFDGRPPASGILAARPPEGKDARFFFRRLLQRNVFVAAREGFLRFSPHVASDEEEASRVLTELKELAAR